MINNSNNIELKNSYTSFIKTWYDLFAIITAKKRALQKELTNVCNDIENSKLVDCSDKAEASSTNSIDTSLTFPKKFSFMAAQKMHALLIENQFIDSSTALCDLCCVFSVPCEDSKNANRVKWIKNNSKVGNKKVNRSSLIDLLTLLGYKQKDIIGEEGQKYKRLNNCFQVGERPITANDFPSYIKSQDENESLKVKSEYHDILVRILGEVDLPKRI